MWRRETVVDQRHVTKTRTIRILWIMQNFLTSYAAQEGICAVELAAELNMLVSGPIANMDIISSSISVLIIELVWSKG